MEILGITKSLYWGFKKNALILDFINQKNHFQIRIFHL